MRCCSRLGRFRTTHWSTQIVDVEHGQLLNIVAGRDAAGACAWFAQRPEEWLTAIRWATLDLSGPYRSVFDTMLPHTTQVAGSVHLIQLANRVLDEGRRRVQNDTLGHRGCKNDPLYRARRLFDDRTRVPHARIATTGFKGCCALAIHAARSAWPGTR
jgi:transposase